MRRWLTVAALTAGLTMSGTVAAQAAPAEADGNQSFMGATSVCPQVETSQALTSYGDDGWYYLVKNGSFTTSTGGWNTYGSAFVTYSTPSPDIMGAGGGALVLSGTAGAQTTAFCTDSTHDRARFFYRGQPGTTIVVKVRSESNIWYTPSSYTVNYRIPVTDNTWRLSQLLHVPDWTDASGAQRTTISFETVGGSAVIDDVMVDPWRFTTG